MINYNKFCYTQGVKNMKKVLFVLVLAAVVAGGVFAQEKEVKNWISGEVSIFGGGIRYEYMLNDKFSVGVNGYAQTLIVWNDLGINAVARFYPFEIFFAELGLGFGYHSGVGDITINGPKGSGMFYGKDSYTYTNEWIGIKGFSIVPGLGFKIDFDSPGGFFVQPGVKVPIIIGKKKPIMDWYGDYEKYYTSEVGVGVGFIVYCGLGYAW